MATTRKQVLDGQTIILTRPQEGAAEFASALTAAGASVTFLPTIQIQPLALTLEAVASIQAALSQSRYDSVIFTSARAVAYFETITRPEHRRLHAYSVGPKTSAALDASWAGPVTQAQKARAEGLIELIATQQRSPARYLFPCSTLARPQLEEGLRAYGHHVERLELYQTSPIEAWPNPAPLLPTPCWVVLASPSAAVGLAASGIDLTEAAVACIGPTTEEAAVSAGLDVTVCAAEPSAAGLSEAIRDASSTRGER